MRQLTGATVELVEAMRGVAPVLSGMSTPVADLGEACGISKSEWCVYAVTGVGSTFSQEDRRTVDCPDCLRLVILARGERQDVIELREAAALTTRVNAELNAEKEKAA
jgi:non-ribosomal peptide synthetase component E (peptide arylation enzyme)